MIELLVVVSIIAVLASMLLPAVGQVRISARTLQCTSILRQYQQANLAYSQDSGGLFVQIRAGSDPIALPDWRSNAAFTELLEMEAGPDFPVRMLCPASYAVQQASGGKGKVMHSYGWNAEELYALPSDLCFWRASQIRRAAEKVAIADSLDWWLSGWASQYYTGESPNGQTMYCAYRHKGRVGIAYFDGHTATMDRREADFIQSATASYNRYWKPTAP